ncbi:hypothetical protein CO654_01295 [Rhizobium sp. L18]|nr:hypothetical protein CO654_01295 [Rhizobium sp. L18]
MTHLLPPGTRQKRRLSPTCSAVHRHPWPSVAKRGASAAPWKNYSAKSDWAPSFARWWVAIADVIAGPAPHPAAATFSPLAGRRGYAATSPFPANVSQGTSPLPVLHGERTFSAPTRYARSSPAQD